jgi:hypothetical protein
MISAFQVSFSAKKSPAATAKAYGFGWQYVRKKYDAYYRNIQRPYILPTYAETNFLLRPHGLRVSQKNGL